MLTLLDNQKKFFNEHNTKSYEFRIKNLVILREIIKNNETLIKEALYEDLGKSYGESYMTEISMVYSEINYLIKNLKRLMKPKKVKTPISLFKGKSYKVYEPLGNVLIISPWNYPFLLAINPLAGAIASGNTAILKLSEYSKSTSNLLLELLNTNFDESFIKVINGDKSVSESLLNLRFDHIFFTGSTTVGKIVMEKASKHLTSVTLELGGKSPLLILDDANIKLAAKRAVFGKLINAGQTCIAPDYLIINTERLEEFKKWFIYYVDKFYKDPLNNDTYPKIISEKHFERLINLLEGEDIILGGKHKKQKLEPTLVKAKKDSSLMSEEIFGPILPVVTYKEENDFLKSFKLAEKPLTMYVFTNDKNKQKEILTNYSSGSIVFNDTLMQFANKNLPFGGVGLSGQGKYHGSETFKTFSHLKSVLKRSTKVDINVRYMPFTDEKIKIIKRLNKWKQLNKIKKYTKMI